MYICALIYNDALESTHSHSGVRLEHGPNQESNNTLITVGSIGEGKKALFCSTDREDCCTNEYNIAGNWFLPNGSQVLSANNTQSFYNMMLGNQTVGLHINMNASNGLELLTGIYHCEMTDEKNVTRYLYAGIYPEDEGMHVLRTIN